MSHGTGERPAGHLPVLLNEALAALGVHPGGVYVDGTFGGGGHALQMLERSAPDGVVYAFDLDPDAAVRAGRLAAVPGIGARFQFIGENFARMKQALSTVGASRVDGVLLDLGLSSYQVDSAKRGFSFLHDAPLDMRFDPRQGAPASDLVNELPERDLMQLLWDFGEESKARAIARAIVAERARRPIETTSALAETVSRASGGRRGARIHPATKTFQALRIATNNELTNLPRGLDSAVSVLRPGGRLVVISFHSLEDRIVKRFIAREAAECVCPPEQPVCTCDHQPRLRAVGKPIRPGEREIQANPRSRSAVMRVAERLSSEAAGDV